jgi:hypothetical protein
MAPALANIEVGLCVAEFGPPDIEPVPVSLLFDGEFGGTRKIAEPPASCCSSGIRTGAPSTSS